MIMIPEGPGLLEKSRKLASEEELDFSLSFFVFLVLATGLVGLVAACGLLSLF
jgi:hypothetical protein